MEKAIDLTKTFAMQAPADLMVVDLEAITKNARAVVDGVAEANAHPPTDQDLQNEYYQLKAESEKVHFNAKQAEQSCNRAAERVRYFENRLKLLKGTVPESEYERLLAKYMAGERVYGHAESFRQIVITEQDLIDARNFFQQMQKISLDRAKTLKNFEKHSLGRMNELKPIVAKQDADYSFIKGTARTKGWGRW
jgi:hypothetical protein